VAETSQKLPKFESSVPWSRLPAELVRMQEENTRLRQQVAQMKEKLREQSALERRRRSYPPDSPRDEEGRVVAMCPDCGQVKTIKARGRCGACYIRWRRSQRQEPIGGMPLSHAPRTR